MLFAPRAAAARSPERQVRLLRTRPPTRFFRLRPGPGPRPQITRSFPPSTGICAPVVLPNSGLAMAATIACRAAIKINMKLDLAKMEWLLKSLALTSCPMTCPHGRPIALRYSTRDILKSFHRI